MRKDYNIGKLFKVMTKANKENREFLFSCVIEEQANGTFIAVVTEEDDCGGTIDEIFRTTKRKSVGEVQKYLDMIFTEANNSFEEWHRIKMAE
jgi:hypothetical protein